MKVGDTSQQAIIQKNDLEKSKKSPLSPEKQESPLKTEVNKGNNNILEGQKQDGANKVENGKGTTVDELI